MAWYYSSVEILRSSETQGDYQLLLGPREYSFLRRVLGRALAEDPIRRELEPDQAELYVALLIERESSPSANVKMQISPDSLRLFSHCFREHAEQALKEEELEPAAAFSEELYLGATALETSLELDKLPEAFDVPDTVPDDWT